jgi:radical S-adenosyl methionine domain-containing protein 2
VLNFGFSFFNYVGMQKINVSGGEPFIEGRHGKFVGEMVRLYCKHELGLSVSIVSNGSLVKEQWFKDYGEYILLVNSMFSVAGCTKARYHYPCTR